MNKKVSGILRILSGVIDYIVILLPVQLITLGFLKLNISSATILFQLLFAVYSIILLEYMNGKTLGKMVAKIAVNSNDGMQPTIKEYGMRELIKSLYFSPYIGWILCIVNAIIILFGDGITLHDRVSQTKVCYQWEK